jgi:hypothetical protein
VFLRIHAALSEVNQKIEKKKKEKEKSKQKRKRDKKVEEENLQQDVSLKRC